jgi:hypothetical protein
MTSVDGQFKQEAVKLVKGAVKKFLFVDDGITMSNNPAFPVFLMAWLSRM